MQRLKQAPVACNLALQSPISNLRYVIVYLRLIKVLQSLIEKLTQHLKIDGTITVQWLRIRIPIALEAILLLPVYFVDLLRIAVR